MQVEKSAKKICGMSYQASLPIFDKSTCAPGSGDGAQPSDSPAGPTISQYGQSACHASLSARQAKGAGLLTSVASLQTHSSGSPGSAALCVSLANRLKLQLSMIGGTLWRHSWSQSATPWGRLVFRLRASGRSISGSGCIGWPSPVVHDHTKEHREQIIQKKANGLSKYGLELRDAAQLAAWPTPRTPTGEPESAERKQKLGRTESGGGDLQAAVQLASWASPASRDYKDINQNFHNGEIGSCLPNQVCLTSGPTPNGFHAATEKQGQLNPAFSLWLMGFGTAWARCAELVTPSSRKRRQNS